jgi:hypothetical protein
LRLCAPPHNRKKWLHLDSDCGGRTAATLLRLVRSSKSLGDEPFAYLRDVIVLVSMHPANRIDDLLPDRRVLPGPAGSRTGQETVGEFARAVDQPESGQGRGHWGWKAASLNPLAEFANSIGWIMAKLRNGPNAPGSLVFFGCLERGFMAPLRGPLACYSCRSE